MRATNMCSNFGSKWSSQVLKFEKNIEFIIKYLCLHLSVYVYTSHNFRTIDPFIRTLTITRRLQMFQCLAATNLFLHCEKQA